MRIGRELRKHQNLMIVCGRATIILGVWAALKAIIVVMSLESDQLADYIHMEPGDITRAIRIAFIVMFVFFSFIVIWIHVRVGISAVYEAMEKKHRRYTVLAFVLLFSAIQDIVNSVTGLVSKAKDILHGQEPSVTADVNLATLLVSLTFFYVIAQLIFSMHRTRKLRKMLDLQGGEA